ncbi:hypothetical protein CVT24_011220 [Panaeolus cyanescens]|uniref:Methyltransferase n=1 Tax=Panaeolus cyanescens TaxID=181874 RepID=A0A409YGE0_9AGAR|nr:hypothetical protein CVT24_011220 [Panaeolus cyanescens]
MTSLSIGPTSITANLAYMKPPPSGTRAFQHTYADPLTGEHTNNFTRDDHSVVVSNIRAHSCNISGTETNLNTDSDHDSTASLDITGFQFHHAPTTAHHAVFNSDDRIKKEYYPEAINLFKQSIRRRTPGTADTDPTKRQPAAQTHVDQTATSALTRLQRHIPTTLLPDLINKRFQIVNLWRPISHSAIDYPLALCDYRSVDDEKDVFPIALVHPGEDRSKDGETLGVRYSPRHRWVYMYGMTPEEVVLIKCFDSIQDATVAKFTPHTAFEDPTTPADTPLRESIEVRALVFYD